ncbi:hypothetical protein C0585_08385 [Candidatus Woesearchaeota archaeon]|nr:MAG: hypothetical protein C0585_08385 [Candidatus Woesearchaeota archaeon]
MKRLTFLMIFIMSLSLVIGAAEDPMHEPGTGLQDPELKEDTMGTGAGNPEAVPTMYTNSGEGQMIQAGERVMAQTGEFQMQSGERLMIQKSESNKYQIETKGVNADCTMELKQEMAQNQTKLYASLSNGKNAEVKVMPDAAAEKAMEQLRLKNCSEGCQLQLKEVGSGDQIRAAYEVQTERQAKVFGLFSAQMKVQAQVDAETGEVIQTKKAWWAFLASEPVE